MDCTGPAERILRATWFEISSEKRWFPLSTDDAVAVEQAHCDPEWRKMVGSSVMLTREAIYPTV